MCFDRFSRVPACVVWQGVTGTVLCWEEHTITQMLVWLGLKSRWRVAEHFAEYGAWDRPAVERQLLELIEQQKPAKWGGDRGNRRR